MQLLVTPGSTTFIYWLNWRVLLCAIWVFTPMVAAVFILWKHECFDDLRYRRGKTEQEVDHSVDEDKAWRPCLEQLHPIWLLAYRAVAFSVLLISLTYKVSVNGFVMFYYYTQWTFTSVTVYFGFGLLLSICGCYRFHKMGKTVSNIHQISEDAEQGYHVALLNEESTNILDTRKFSNPQEEINVSKAASVSIYFFQVLFQMNAGAVMLTDCVYWAIIFPFLTIRDYNLNFMTMNMHTVNAILLLGDAALNCLPFPWFRISYFILWTGVFVIFQWIVHACISIWWPYPFLDLSSPHAPLWYLAIGLMHLPCYGFFGLMIKMKHFLFSKWFPRTYRLR